MLHTWYKQFLYYVYDKHLHTHQTYHSATHIVPYKHSTDVLYAICGHLDIPQSVTSDFAQPHL